MLCPECNKREAEVHFTQIINNKKVSISLCQQCAAKLGFHSPLDDTPFPLAEILTGMTQGFVKPVKGEEMEKLVCTHCDLSFEEFARQGRFGCGRCYNAFRPRLEVIMRKIHGSSLHRGRNPGMATDAMHSEIVPVKEEERLSRELRKAIESEDFERAADLRDKLKSFRAGQTVDN